MRKVLLFRCNLFPTVLRVQYNLLGRVGRSNNRLSTREGLLDRYASLANPSAAVLTR